MKTVLPWDHGPKMVDQELCNSQRSFVFCLLFVNNPSLGPASVRDVPHDVVLGEVQPVPSHHLVTVPVGAMGVTDHLGRPSSSAGEVDLHSTAQLSLFVSWGYILPRNHYFS